MYNARMDLTAASAALSHVSALSKHELVSRVRSLNADGNRLLADLLVHLGEMDARKLFKDHACSSMFAFCRRLGMSEGSTARRLDSARVIRRFPKLLPLVERGELHLTALSIVSGILTPANVDSVIASVRGKSRREVEEVRVRYAPRPDVKDSVRKQPSPAAFEAPRPSPVAPATALVTPPVAVKAQSMAATPSAAPTTEQRSLLDAVASRDVPAPSAEAPRVLIPMPSPSSFVESPPPVAAPMPPPAPAPAPAIRISRPVAPIVPLREDGYKVQFTASKAIVDKLDRVKEMMRHRNPKGDLATIVEAALDLLAAKLEKERFAKTTRPRKTARPCAEGTVPAATRREVFERDGEQCTWVDAEGNRCCERGWLEIDHVRAKRRRGSEAVINLRILCKAHNQHHAVQDFGEEYIARRIEESRRATEDRKKKREVHSAGGGEPSDSS